MWIDEQIYLLYCEQMEVIRRLRYKRPNNTYDHDTIYKEQLQLVLNGEELEDI